jgi:hypothetical protein
MRANGSLLATSVAVAIVFAETAERALPFAFHQYFPSWCLRGNRQFVMLFAINLPTLLNGLVF